MRAREAGACYKKAVILEGLSNYTVAASAVARRRKLGLRGTVSCCAGDAVGGKARSPFCEATYSLRIIEIAMLLLGFRLTRDKSNEEKIKRHNK